MNIEDKVLLIIQDNTEDKSGVKLESNLRQDLRLDSFGTLMILNAIEEAFGISVEEGDFREINTIADVVKLLRTKYHCA